MSSHHTDMFKSTVLGHPQGLFILFFTEMWERFSYYGMRALLILFLVGPTGVGGWDLSILQASSLYGTYTAMVYLTPILGGYLADRFIGNRKAVIIGAVLMTLGHASMAIESSHLFLYLGIGFLIIGNGFFKPNITSIISNMYKDTPEKKDSAYTIFYMGVNAGSFLGIMLCGYLGEKLGWQYGFGLAGVFMFLGMLQFYFSQGIFGEIGGKQNRHSDKTPKLAFEGDRLNPFTHIDKVLIWITATAGLIWVINDPLSKIGEYNLLQFGSYNASNAVIISALVLFFLLLIYRIVRYPKITRDRMLAIIFFAICTILFWASFEQAGNTMTIFAQNHTSRILTGFSANLFITVNIVITVVPIGIITWVLFLLFKKTVKDYFFSSIILGSSFLLIWGIVAWMIQRDLHSKAYVVEFSKIETTSIDKQSGKAVQTYTSVNQHTKLGADLVVVKDTSLTIREPLELQTGTPILLLDTDKKGNLRYLDPENAEKVSEDRIVAGTILRLKEKEVEIQASWFGILNSLFIILFAPLISKWWESKYNPSAAKKYGLGLIILGIGFAALAFGALSITSGSAATTSIFWLVVAYLFHTLGELCLSPVSLSYISKLVPSRMIALMFGIWYIAIAIGNKLSGLVGGQVETFQENHSWSFFYFLFAGIPIGFGILAIFLSPLIQKLMHGVK
jgi:proton-dependent oligopeptide transporter, POT family